MASNTRIRHVAWVLLLAGLLLVPTAVADKHPCPPGEGCEAAPLVLNVSASLAIVTIVVLAVLAATAVVWTRGD